MLEKDIKKESLEAAIIDCSGDKPLPRFGHSLVMISPENICLFGGLEEKKYSNDTYIYKVKDKIWLKVNFKKENTLPCERAAHAAAANDNRQMVIYGGSNNSGLVDDKLWIFHLNDYNEGNEGNEGIWYEKRTFGPTPGQRYGHSLIFLDPFFVLFGGGGERFIYNNLMNDLWIVNIKKDYCEWEKLNLENNNIIPCPRLYHTCNTYLSGNCSAMMIIFGGRDSNKNPLNDIWRLKIQNERKWSWSQLKGYQMKSRYYHSMIVYNELIIVFGGKGLYTSTNEKNPLPIEIFNIETNEGFESPGISMIRQTNFIYDKNVFLFGGLGYRNKVKSLCNLYNIPLEKILKANNKIANKSIENFNNKNNQKENIIKNEIINDIETNNINNIAYENNKELEKELEEEKSKNKKLNEKINQLESSLKIEKNKYLSLKNKFNELNNKLELMNYNNIEIKNKSFDIKIDNKELFNKVIIEKENEIKELKQKLSRFPFELNKGEKIISLIFITLDENIHTSIICKNTDKFNKIENKIYEDYPEYSGFDNIFTVNGNKIIKSKNLDENKIHHNDIIILNNYDS